MGISVISLIEIVYFLGIRVRHHYVQDQRRSADQLTTTTATKNVVQVLQLAKAGGGGSNVVLGGGDVEQRRDQLQLPSQRIVMMTRPTAGDGGKATWNPEVRRRQ